MTFSNKEQGWVRFGRITIRPCDFILVRINVSVLRAAHDPAHFRELMPGSYFLKMLGEDCSLIVLLIIHAWSRSYLGENIVVVENSLHGIRYCGRHTTLLGEMRCAWRLNDDVTWLPKSRRLILSRINKHNTKVARKAFCWECERKPKALLFSGFINKKSKYIYINT